MNNEAHTDARRLVPVEPTEAMIEAGMDFDERVLTLRLGRPPTVEECQIGEWKAMLSAAPASPLPGGGPHKRWSILNHLGESWTPENFGTERQATAYLDGWKRDNPKMDLSKHKVVPVLVTMTSAPTGDA